MDQEVAGAVIRGAVDDGTTEIGILARHVDVEGLVAVEVVLLLRLATATEIVVVGEAGGISMCRVEAQRFAVVGD